MTLFVCERKVEHILWVLCPRGKGGVSKLLGLSPCCSANGRGI